MQGSKVFNFFSSELIIKLIVLTNVKMPTVVGIVTFISKINTNSIAVKQAITLFYSILIIMHMSSRNFIISLVEHENVFLRSAPDKPEDKFSRNETQV